MSRNVTILVIILVILLVAGYLLWLRGRFQATTAPQAPVEQIISPTAIPTVVNPSATPIATTSATPTGKQISPTPTKTATTSGRTAR